MPAKLRIIAQAMKKSPLEAFHVILEFSNQESKNRIAADFLPYNKCYISINSAAMRNLIRYADALLQLSHIPYFLAYT